MAISDKERRELIDIHQAEWRRLCAGLEPKWQKPKYVKPKITQVKGAKSGK